MASNTRGENIVLLDLRGRSPVTEFFVLATGTSPRQMRTVAEEMRELGKRMGSRAWQTSGVESARWILVDCVNVVIHIFSEESREFYDLELLWGDCPRIDWRKELGLPPAPEWKPRAPAPPRLTEEERLAQDFGDEGEDDFEMDDEDDEDASVMIEVPDESTGSNSVELVEVEPPFRKRGKSRSSFPTTIEEEDTTEEERSMNPVRSRRGIGASRDQDARQRRAEAKAAKDIEAISAEDISRKPTKKAKKAPAKKTPAKAKAAKPKTVKKAAKATPVKKAPARKPAAKKPAAKKKSAAKPAAKKKAPAKKPKKK